MDVARPGGGGCGLAVGTGSDSQTRQQLLPYVCPFGMAVNLMRFLSN